MANVIYTIPDHLLDLAYDAYYGSPNSDLFTRNQLQRKPIPPLGLDNLALWTSDALQDLQETIAGINREKIGVEGQKLQLLYFSDDEGTLQAISLQDLINSLLAPLALDGSNIGEETIYGASLRKNTLKKDHYGLQSIETEAIKDLAVSNAKLQPLPLSKTVSSGQACLVIGQTGETKYKELSYLGHPKFVIPAIGDDGVLKLYNLASIWYYSLVEYEGSKLRDTSVALSKIGVGLDTEGVISSRQGNTSPTITAVDPNMFGVVSGGGGNGVSFRPLPDVWNINTYANLADGKTLKDGTVPFSKLQALPGKVAPFAMGYVQANGTYPKVTGLTASRSATGTYSIAFTTQAGNTYYIVQLTPDLTNVGGGLTMNVSNRSVNGFTVTVTSSAGNLYDVPFSVLVYSF